MRQIKFQDLLLVLVGGHGYSGYYSKYWPAWYLYHGSFQYEQAISVGVTRILTRSPHISWKHSWVSVKELSFTEKIKRYQNQWRNAHKLMLKCLPVIFKPPLAMFIELITISDANALNALLITAANFISRVDVGCMSAISVDKWKYISSMRAFQRSLGCTNS